MKTQGTLKDEIINRTNSYGIFIQEKEVEYEGENLLVYIFMPQSLAEKADVVANLIVYSHDGIETKEDESTENEPKEEKPKSKPVKKPPTKKAKKK